VTVKDLQKWLNNVQSNNSTATTNLGKEDQQKKEEIKLYSERFEVSRDKPFWIENIEDHRREDIRTKGNCCFNHILGLPRKNGVDKPLIMRLI
jgi:hypothetical protein